MIVQFISRLRRGNQIRDGNNARLNGSCNNVISESENSLSSLPSGGPKNPVFSIEFPRAERGRNREKKAT